MFGFNHPRPPSRKEVAMHVVQQESRTFSVTELFIDPPDRDRHVAPPPPGLPVRFSVAYTLADYLGIVREHLAFLMRRDSPAGRRAKWLWPVAIALGGALLAWFAGPGWLRALLLAGGALSLASLPAMTGFWTAVILPPIFYLKKRRMPVCSFSIDGAGIERTTAQGRMVRRWDQVRMVRRYRLGYLVMFEKGGIPIPFRCLTAAQQQGLRAFAAGRTGPAPA